MDMLQFSARTHAPPKVFVSSPTAYKALLTALRFSPETVSQLRSRHVFVSEDLLDDVLVATKNFDTLPRVAKHVKEKTASRKYIMLGSEKIYMLEFSDPSPQWQAALLMHPKLDGCRRTLEKEVIWQS